MASKKAAAAEQPEDLDEIAAAVAAAPRNGDGTITIYPEEGVYLHPYLARRQDVTPELADELLRYQPPPFTTVPPPQSAAAEQPEGPSEQDGSSDSGEVAS